MISPAGGEIQEWNSNEPGASVKADVALKSADSAAHDALLLPGNLMEMDQLRTQADAVHFVRAFFDAN